MMSKGADRVSKQLDIVKFIKTQMVLDLMLKKWMTPLERFFARRQFKKFVLHHSDHTESLSDQVVEESTNFGLDSKLYQTRRDELFGSMTGSETHLESLAVGIFKPGKKTLTLQHPLPLYADLNSSNNIPTETRPSIIMQQ